MVKLAVVLLLGVLTADGCRRHHPRGDAVDAVASSSPSAAPPAAAAPDPAGESSSRVPTATRMENVHLRVGEGIAVDLRYLEGEAEGIEPGAPVALDDKNSYVIHVDDAETVIRFADLSRLLNDYVFAFDGAPVHDLTVEREGDDEEAGEIALKGRLRTLGIPFEIEGRPEPTADGRIRIRTTSIQAADVEVEGLMKLLKLDAGDLVGNLERRGIEVAGNDVILVPDRAFPPPRIQGRVTYLRVEAEDLVLGFGRHRGHPRSSGRRGNYLAFRHGTIRIGKMTMTDADLRIVDEDAHDPLDFNGDHLTRQLVAGYSKLSANGGLTIYVPDFADVAAR